MAGRSGQEPEDELEALAARVERLERVVADAVASAQRAVEAVMRQFVSDDGEPRQ